MASIVHSDPHPSIRPLSFLRDVHAIADLIEQCFSATMDGDGRRSIADMRRVREENSFFQWANRVAETTSLPLTGYIWEEYGRIVGNVSLIPFRKNNHRLYLVANVAVHPDYRRKGIARALTLRAMQHAREKKVDDIWLHVRSDNTAALPLYQSLGFEERSRRNHWQASTTRSLNLPETDITITKRYSRFWPQQAHWLSRLYPEEMSWHTNWNLSLLKPGLLNWVYRQIIDIHTRQWAATRKDNLLATLSWMPTGRGEGLFAAIGERSDPEALKVLLLEARHSLYNLYPHIKFDFPVSRFDTAVLDAGFTLRHTLVWMQATS